MTAPQLTLIQAGEFIVCEDVAYTPAEPAAPPRITKPHRASTATVEPVIGIGAAFITATTALPINTMKSAAVRIDDEIVPLPFIRTQERKVVSNRIRIDGPLATRIAAWLGLDAARTAPIK